MLVLRALGATSSGDASRLAALALLSDSACILDAFGRDAFSTDSSSSGILLLMRSYRPYAGESDAGRAAVHWSGSNHDYWRCRWHTVVRPRQQQLYCRCTSSMVASPTQLYGALASAVPVALTSPVVLAPCSGRWAAPHARPSACFLVLHWCYIASRDDFYHNPSPLVGREKGKFRNRGEFTRHDGVLGVCSASALVRDGE